jgi:ribosomal subunit interface protein
MNTDICVRHFEITSAIRTYAERQLDALDHLCSADWRAHLILDHDHHHGEGEYLSKAHLRGTTGKADAEVRSADLYAGIDQLVQKLEMQLRKLHERTCSDFAEMAAGRFNPDLAAGI